MASLSTFDPFAEMNRRRRITGLLDRAIRQNQFTRSSLVYLSTRLAS